MDFGNPHLDLGNPHLDFDKPDLDSENPILDFGNPVLNFVQTHQKQADGTFLTLFRSTFWLNSGSRLGRIVVHILSFSLENVRKTHSGSGSQIDGLLVHELSKTGFTNWGFFGSFVDKVTK